MTTSTPARGRSGMRAIATAAGIVALVTIVARAAGFVRTAVFSGNVGATPIGQVYQSANTLPNVVFEVAAGGALAAVAVPLVAAHVGREDREGADRIASALLTWAVTVLVPLAVVLALVAGPVSRFLIGSEGVAAELGADLIVLFAPQVLLYGVAVVLGGVLQAHRRFLAAALAPLLSSIAVIGAYIAYGAITEPGVPLREVSDAAVLVLGLGTTAGVLVLALPLLVPVWRAGIRLRPTWTFPDGVSARARSLAAAGVMALSAQQLAVVTTIWLANRSGDPGTLNVYVYVQAVYLLPYAVLAIPLATTALPTLAQDAARGAETVPVLARSARAVLLLSGWGTAVLLSVAGPLGAFFGALDRGANGPGDDALAALPAATLAYAPGLVGFGLAALLTRALYVRGEPLRAAGAVATGWMLAAVAPLLIVPPGAGAAATLRLLGISSSVGMTASAVILVVLVRKAWGAAALQGSGKTVGGLVVATAVAVALGDVVAAQLHPTGIAEAVGAGLVTALVATLFYFLVMSLSDRETIASAVRRGREIRRR